MPNVLRSARQTEFAVVTFVDNAWCGVRYAAIFSMVWPDFRGRC